ncbi:type II toxin-antitoxin system PemK/MazF family toxin [Candidatus Mycobacterium methanotrophicum]|uniref:Type II toxin-antitoxin system PemK/MazF family toxin n=1 Tax=Candidatus Mycobacterium methanotrophicum TaxID=2943498 RepID=A0ABY4QKD9_9MYCO|nr:type II toxin-antitoxin system PemK/MazF family toxin [Candidatus Mycobacterium methanotrophicum]UQX11495.1 type II toxin-antitoxin system PemK/MazF family toxin [Candidatus Mycobacterium methanotrophicum]
MRRGELWTAAGGKHYAGKPRPVLIVQDDRFDATSSITVCPLTSDPTEIPLLRVPLDPDDSNCLDAPSSIMIDKITTMARSKLGARIGKVSDAGMLALSRSLVVFLGFA